MIRDHETRIIARRDLGPDVFRLALHAPSLAAELRPGQFLQIIFPGIRLYLFRHSIFVCKPILWYNIPKGVFQSCRLIHYLLLFIHFFGMWMYQKLTRLETTTLLLKDS